MGDGLAVGWEPIAAEEFGGGSGVDERGAEAVADEVVDVALLAKKQLGLGRVNVHVHFLRRHFKEQEHRWKAGGWNHVPVGLSDCVQQKKVAYKALVDKDIN